MSSKNEEASEEMILALLEAGIKQKKPYGTFKGGWLKSMRTLSGPFARYNRNVQSYLQDPELHEFNKLVIKLHDFCEKLYKNKKALLNISKIPKNLVKLYTLTTKITEHPVYLSKKYNESMNVKETLEGGDRLKDYLCNLAEQFKVYNPLPSKGVMKEQQAEL